MYLGTPGQHRQQEIVFLEADLSLEEDGSDDPGLSALLVHG